ncbi:hypothetical protein ACFOWA_10645 [Pedobacter lithocola]|uniref:Uncharacterized protein n=1 Tax=Pedobacter lithocola TaxID=1908239 RepID=A0ABV8PBV0_9SPHI
MKGYLDMYAIPDIASIGMNGSINFKRFFGNDWFFNNGCRKPRYRCKSSPDEESGFRLFALSGLMCMVNRQENLDYKEQQYKFQKIFWK